jgi:hypothetical protein
VQGGREDGGGLPYVNWEVPGGGWVPYIELGDFCRARGGRTAGISGLEMDFRAAEVHRHASRWSRSLQGLRLSGLRW